MSVLMKNTANEAKNGLFVLRDVVAGVRPPLRLGLRMRWGGQAREVVLRVVSRDSAELRES